MKERLFSGAHVYQYTNNCYYIYFKKNILKKNRRSSYTAISYIFNLTKVLKSTLFTDLQSPLGLHKMEQTIEQKKKKTEEKKNSENERTTQPFGIFYCCCFLVKR